jgi:alanine-synthesizing transaminase
MFEKTEPRPKFLILNFPHNPTAKMVAPGFYEEVVAMAKRIGFWVVNDFAYGLTTYDERRAPSFLAVKGAKDVGAELFTMSKQHNMAGWRIGFFAGNARLVECLGVVKGYFDYGHNQALQLGAVKALDSGDQFIREQCAVYQKRRDALLAGLAEAGWGRLGKQHGTMFTWQRMPDCVRQMGSLDFCFKLAEKAGVSFTPGIAFGPEGEGFVRIALVADEDRIREACRRVKTFLNKG